MKKIVLCLLVAVFVIPTSAFGGFGWDSSMEEIGRLCTKHDKLITSGKATGEQMREIFVAINTQALAVSKLCDLYCQIDVDWRCEECGRALDLAFKYVGKTMFSAGKVYESEGNTARAKDLYRTIVSGWSGHSGKYISLVKDAEFALEDMKEREARRGSGN